MNVKNPSHAFTLTFNGIAQQLITEVTISEAYDLTKAPNPLPTSVQANALWDTGATHTSISATLAVKLGLVSSGAGVFSHAGGSSPCKKYVVNLVLPNKVTVVGVFVNECILPQNFEILIGMDIIAQGDFSVTNVGKKTLFSFRIPSIESVDFVKQHAAQRFAGVPANAPCPCGSGKKFKKCCRP